MNTAHELILVAGALGLLSIVAGVVSSRFQAPLLLVFLMLGMAAGEDGPGGIVFNDFQTSYLVGSIALAVILFEGGLKVEPSMIRAARWPALAMATAGVALTAAVVGIAAVWLFSLPWTEALLLGAVLSPTDAAAVNTLLRASRVSVPERVTAMLELESGLNDPMAVFLTAMLVHGLTAPAGFTAGNALLTFAQEMAGGALAGLLGGYGLLWLLRRLHLPTPVYPVLALASVLTVFGASQTLGASGFLAVYLMGVIVGVKRFKVHRALVYAAESFASLAQITLFVLLGLLVTPHKLAPMVLPIFGVTGVLLFIARPVATFACLLPFRYSASETAFASWVGLRGAAPIYLTIVPVLEGVRSGGVIFGAVFGVVIASLVLQGWTIGPAARALGFRKARP